MTDELSFKVYLSLSQNKFEIYLLDKKNLKKYLQGSNLFRKWFRFN